MASIAEKLSSKIKETPSKRRKPSSASTNSLPLSQPKITIKRTPRKSSGLSVQAHKILKLTNRELKELADMRLESLLPPPPPKEEPPKTYNPWLPKHFVQEIDPPYSKREHRQPSPLLKVPFEEEALEPKQQPKQSKSPNEGHRSRLKDRIIGVGWSTLADYELLELFLAYAQPRKDTKPLSKILLNTFCGLGGVFAAEAVDLMRVKGVGNSIATLMQVAHGIMVRILRAEARERPCLDDIDSVVEYCRIFIGHGTKEANLVLFLDSKNFLLDTEMRIQGTVDQVHTYPREIISKALECKAKSIIMVHNHPSGDTTPSNEDIEITQHVKALAQLMGISLHDHLIVSREEVYSMRANNDI